MKRFGVNNGLRIAVVALALTGLFVAPIAQAATFQLPAGTEIKVKFSPATKISSADMKVGTELMITLAEPITIGDQVLVTEGAAGTAVVTEVEKAKAPGKPGRIVVEFKDIGTRGGYQTVDGTPIQLNGKVEMKGKGKKLLAFITIVGIFLIKGGQGEIKSDSTYTAKVKETIILQSE